MQKALAFNLCILHRQGMRTHFDIIEPSRVDEIALSTGKSVHTVRSWRQRNSIPADVWAKLSEMGIATLEELALAAASTPREEQDTPSPFPADTSDKKEAA